MQRDATPVRQSIVRNNHVFTLVALTAIAVLVGVGQRAEPESRPPVISFSGPHSAITERAFHFITTQATFADLWASHIGEKAERMIAHSGGVIGPTIDFERFAVVAYFRGRSYNCDGEYVISIDEFEDRVRIRFDSHTFQTSSFGDEPDPGERVTPYGIWVISRTNKSIVLEENTQGLIGREPVWTERQRFNEW